MPKAELHNFIREFVQDIMPFAREYLRAALLRREFLNHGAAARAVLAAELDQAPIGRYSDDIPAAVRQQINVMPIRLSKAKPLVPGGRITMRDMVMLHDLVLTQAYLEKHGRAKPNPAAEKAAGLIYEIEYAPQGFAEVFEALHAAEERQREADVLEFEQPAEAAAEIVNAALAANAA